MGLAALLLVFACLRNKKETMSISSAISALFTKEKAAVEAAASHVEHPTLASTRLWVTVGFGAALIWLCHGLLTDVGLICMTVTANCYMICNTVTRAKSLDKNGDINYLKATPAVEAPKTV
jgi:hypothetical protein